MLQARPSNPPFQCIDPFEGSRSVREEIRRILHADEGPPLLPAADVLVVPWLCSDTRPKRYMRLLQVSGVHSLSQGRPSWTAVLRTRRRYGRRWRSHEG